MDSSHRLEIPPELTSSSSNDDDSATQSTNSDFVFIKIVARITLQLLRRFWAFSSAAVLAIILFYWLCGGFIALCMVIFAFTGLLYHAGDRLLYHPDQPATARVFVPSPSMFGLPFENIYIRSKDKTRLHMFLVMSPHVQTSQINPNGDQDANNSQDNNRGDLTNTHSAPPTILFLHGNAGNIGHRLLNVKDIVDRLHCNVCLLEYRGYGHSDGSPSEEGIYMDAQAALDYLSTYQRSDVIDPRKIIVFGRSLGGAIAIDLCSRTENRDLVAALLVENSFTSIPDIARVLFDFKAIKWIPRWFYKNQYSARWKVCRLPMPCLFLSGTADHLVPPAMMSELYRACGSERKHLAKFPGGTHNETWSCSHYYQTILYFLEEVAQMPISNIYVGKSTKQPPPTIVSSECGHAV